MWFVIGVRIIEFKEVKWNFALAGAFAILVRRKRGNKKPGGSGLVLLKRISNQTPGIVAQLATGNGGLK